MNMQFTEAETSMATKHQERCFASLVMREMQMKTTVANHSTSSVWQIHGSLAKSIVGKELRKWDWPGIVGGNKSWHNLECALPYSVNLDRIVVLFI